MSQPTVELADIVGALRNDFIVRNRSWLTWPQVRVLLAIQRCRTAALGGHLDGCSRCGHQAISYNSCRNRHCPRCQTSARNRWVAERSNELLPVPYSHVVFTVPHQLAALVYQNKRILYGLLLRASAATLLQIAADPLHLGADIGFFSVCIPGARTCNITRMFIASFRREAWLSIGLAGLVRGRFFLPVKVLGKVFR